VCVLFSNCTYTRLQTYKLEEWFLFGAIISCRVGEKVQGKKRGLYIPFPSNLLSHEKDTFSSSCDL
jgi:hypothetical protein